ncbi:MAG: WYL domain-containing protein [Lachnospiraceae bacterium]|nr:WYL domain-containing protein [Lachnospiraceae bacterium]
MKTFDSDFSDNKQHIGISPLAYSIIESDFRRFEYSETIKSFNGFLNRIIQNCHYLPFDFYPCNLQAIYEREIKLNKNNFEISNLIVKKYKDYPCNNIEEKVNTSFTIVKSLYILLTSLSNSHTSDFFNNRVGKYINSILEEYASLPFSKRETIIFIDSITELNECISSGATRNITHANGNQFYFIPYKIATDNMGMYYYVIGKSLPYDCNHPSTEKLCSFRIDRITVGYSNKQLSLSYDDKKALDTCIRNGDIEYLLDEKKEFTVVFSPKGYNMYKSIFAKRPQYTSISKKEQTNEIICTFNCTEYQFENYFKPFGSLINDIKPDSMKKKFIEFYKEAYEKLLL